MISKLHYFFSGLAVMLMLSATACTPATEKSNSASTMQETTKREVNQFTPSDKKMTDQQQSVTPLKEKQNSTVNLSDLLSGKNSDEANVCRQTGGNWQRVCLSGNYSCVKPYSDAGQSCASQGDCEGRCLQSPNGSGGVCQSNSNPCGCFSLYEAGQPQSSICID